MNSLEIFNKFYEKNEGHESAQSLINFFNEQVRNRLTEDQKDILDLGCGTVSIFENLDLANKNITAIDFSDVAISKTPVSKISYRIVDISQPKIILQHSYDLVFDSHCFNCITDEAKRKTAFENTYEALKPDGLFVSEFMIQSIDKKISMPHKLIRTSHEQENEILKYGFKILYFMISKNNFFVTEEDGVEKTCDVLRVIAKK